ncbi:hypothetical protein C8J57DRAFT_1460440 [Mycena rebaudengoi]|nr:hypothetical protein C8J57DRAFT_1460440 [Mycena rebaudengoi]
MPHLFCSLPEDLILEVVDFLSLRDAISLLLTCSSLYDLSRKRSFWISLLETTREASAIACSPYDDLSQCTLERLKDLAFSWLRLQRNWDDPAPRLMQPAMCTTLDEKAEFAFMVQGTDIVVLHLHLKDSHQLVCWDAKEATLFPVLPVDTGGQIHGHSQPHASRGVCRLAFIDLRMDRPLSVLTIKHENGKALSFERAFVGVPSPVPSGFYFEATFVTADTAGSVLVTRGDRSSVITTQGIDSSTSEKVSVTTLKLPHTIFGDEEQSVCFAYKNHLYILFENGLSVRIQHVLLSALSSGHQNQYDVHESIFPALLKSGSSEPGGFMLPSSPCYGIGALIDVFDDDSTPTTAFTFIPTTLVDTADKAAASPLGFLPGVTVLLPAQMIRSSLWMDHSGFNVVAIMDSDEEDSWLTLIRYHSESASATTHRLVVPDCVDLDEIDALSVDDSAGVVHLTDNSRILTTLHYC